jgi:multidrug efflux pump subunit AcrA (membrane-fusion protein)
MMSSPSFVALSLLLSFAQVSLAQVGGVEIPSAEVSDPVIEGMVKVADDIKLPAQEDGVLVHMTVEEGSIIRKGQQLGQIDDSMQKKQRLAADYAFKVAYERGLDDVEIKFAKAKSEAAKADYDLMLETNRIAAKTITVIEMRQKEMEWIAATMSIEKATKDQKLARLEAVAKKAELDIADLAIQKRIIKAPFNGMVEKVYRKQDEWVMHGDPIMYLFRLDTMNVEGAVEQAKYDPHELQGCDVTVEVQLARGRKETVRGRITKVSAVVDLDGKYAVRAEVPNREEHGSWLLRDGMVATMTIHLGTGSGGGGVTRVPR